MVGFCSNASHGVLFPFWEKPEQVVIEKQERDDLISLKYNYISLWYCACVHARTCLFACARA